MKRVKKRAMETLQTPNNATNAKKHTSTTTCACSNPKQASKPTYSLSSFLAYIRGTEDTVPTKVCVCGNLKNAGALCCPACGKSLWYCFVRRSEWENLEVSQLVESVNEDGGIGIAGKCSICGGNYIFGGNNPQPVIDDHDARCCDQCNFTVVLPARDRHIEEFGRAY